MKSEIRVRVKESDKKTLIIIADKKGLNLSAYIRMILIENIEKERQAAKHND